VVLVLIIYFNIPSIQVVAHELQKFLPNCKVKYFFGDDWRNDAFVRRTWFWYKPDQVQSSFTPNSKRIFIFC
jgi:hypothetical protein